MSRAPLAIAALVSAGLNPVSGARRACRGDAVAMALAKTLGNARVLHAGQASEPALYDYLALGADKIEVVGAEGGAIAALAAALSGTDLVLTGTRAETGAGSGLLPYALAKHIGWPIVTDVLEIEIRDREAFVMQFLPRGKRRRLAVTLPAVITVHPRADVSLTYAFARRRTGRIVSLPATAMQEGESGKPMPVWTPAGAPRQPQRLTAGEMKPAHERLAAAISAEQKKGITVSDGTPAEKASRVLAYLREHKLVDF